MPLPAYRITPGPMPLPASTITSGLRPPKTPSSPPPPRHHDLSLPTPPNSTTRHLHLSASPPSPPSFGSPPNSHHHYRTQLETPPPQLPHSVRVFTDATTTAPTSKPHHCNSLTPSAFLKKEKQPRTVGFTPTPPPRAPPECRRTLPRDFRITTATYEHRATLTQA
ncbi:leucine-rich repeat extensin-like protein 5 [Rhododendron vialii]|uniref:leucine-rich repeat extensin-like protein 5 n=1 Tax=Rhododendron vialii TaxID=182163 RepID=UPI00265F0F65|nr:leucine-rich repeat extensin-like protein 5 [Rhododendron vialii]